MREETLEKLEKYPNLKKYSLSFEKTGGREEVDGFLPYLVIWFRDLFEKAGIDDSEVPIICDMDDETAEDFWSWGHNSRYANTFTYWLVSDVDFAVNMALEIIENNNLVNFDPDIEEQIEQERKR